MTETKPTSKENVNSKERQRDLHSSLAICWLRQRVEGDNNFISRG